MDTLLLVITIISAASAIAAVTSAARLRRDERERSEARVAALSTAAETHPGTLGGWQQVDGEWRWETEPSDSQPAAVTVSPVSEPQTASATSETASDAFFGTVQREEPTGHRLPMFAAAALIVMLGGALIFLNTSASNDHAAASAATVGHAEPLELVALEHARKTNVLTITGTVRNPMSGAKVEGLTAVVSLLDRDGGLVSTKDVPLDYRALAPGEEAPFKVSVPDPGSVVRYRVSFRAGTDVVPHVDRRVSTKLASARQ